MANIIKYEKAALAKMDGETLQKKIDGCVRASFKTVERLDAERVAAKRALDDYKGEDLKVLADLRRAAKTTALACKDAIQNIEDYLAEQKALFASRGLNPDRAYKEAIVPTGEVTEGGVEVCRIVQRGVTLEEADEDDATKCSVAASRSYSARTGIDRDQRRGKYNDASLLIHQQSMSVDPSEVCSWGSACL